MCKQHNTLPWIHTHKAPFSAVPHLVPNEANLDSVAAGGVSDAPHPVRRVVERLRVGHVVHQHDAVRAAVVRLRYLVEFLLTKWEARPEIAGQGTEETKGGGGGGPRRKTHAES